MSDLTDKLREWSDFVVPDCKELMRHAADTIETLEGMLKCYLAKREGDESFHTFCNRHTVGQLQELFSNS